MNQGDEADDAHDVTSLQLIRLFNDLLILSEPLMLDLWHRTGLTVMQMRILRYLLEADAPVFTGEIAELVDVSAPSLSRILGRLEDAALVERIPDPFDRRRVNLQATPEGVKLWKSRSLLRGTVFHKAASAMTPTERNVLAKWLGRYRDAVEFYSRME